MSAQSTILLALLLPLAGAAGIVLAGRVSANLRETVTLVTAGGLAATVLFRLWQKTVCFFLPSSLVAL